MSGRRRGDLRTRARARARWLRIVASQWMLPALMAFLFVLAVLVGVAGAPYVFTGATLESEVARQLRATTGLAFSAGVSGRFDLLPRPHVVFYKLHIADPGHKLDVTAEEFDGDVRLLPLIVGRIELSSVTLTQPHLAVDLDAKASWPDSLIGHAISAPSRAANQQALGSVSLVDGRATITSKSLSHAVDLAAINVTLDWPDLETPATFAGSLEMGGTNADVAAWLAQPVNLLRGDHSAVALHVHAPQADLSANGDLVDAATTAFRGHLSTTMPSASALVALLGDAAPIPAPFANLSLNSDASLGIDPQRHVSVDLPNLVLRTDGNAYEGTVAYMSGPWPTLSGTLATEDLSLAPFLQRMPGLLDAARRWSDAPLIGRPPKRLGLDLRFSATHVRLAPVTIDDAAVAVITRDDRTEIALVGGKAYGGTAKGRLSFVIADNGLDLRASGSLTDADAASLAWDAFGRQLVTGTLTASMNVETNGATPAALMHGLQGWAKGRIEAGELSGVDVGRALREIARKRPQALMNALRSGRTTFGSLVLGARILDGVALIDDGTMQGTDETMTFGGSADIGERSLDLRCAANPPESQTAANGGTGSSLVFKVEGPFDRPHLAPDPATPIPLVPTPDGAKKAPPR